MKSTPKIASFSIILIFISIALAGVAFVPLLPVKLSPSHALPKLTVSFAMPNSSARVVEMEVTAKLEAMLARIRGVKNISSLSDNGRGSITIEFDKHTSMDAARFEASTIVRQTWSLLPDGVSYPTIRMSRPDEKSARPFLSYTLNAPATPIYIQRYAEEYIKPTLSRIPGIYKIDVTGGTPLEWVLEYDTDRLKTLSVSVESIKQAVSEFYHQEDLGTVNRGSDGKSEWIRLAIRHSAEGLNSFDPTRIVVASSKGELFTLDKLLTVKHQEEMPQSYYRINGLNSIYLFIQAEESANQIELAKQIKQEIERLKPSLPVGYEVHNNYDATEYIATELNKIYIRTLLTVLILLLFVIIITRSVKYLLLIVTSLAVNLFIAVIIYYLLGLEMQLYSLAGITISLSLVIDNTIIMTEHIRNSHNRKAILSILTATLTTMGALVIIFFLDESIRLNLQDFAAVVIVNLAVSLAVALFLVPALVDKLHLEWKTTGKRKVRFKRLRAFTAHFKRERSFYKRLPIYLNRFYAAQIGFMTRWKVVFCILLMLAFGLPTFTLPDKIEYDSKKKEYSVLDSLLIDTYNDAVGSSTYKEDIKPYTDVALGGTLRLFVEKVYNGSYFTHNEETVLSVSASLPNGSTLSQMNHLIKQMEAYLTHFPTEIRQFQTNVYSANQAGLNIYFTKEAEESGFPYLLKSKIIGKALELGGGSWNVWGLPDQGFSNNVRENAGSYRIEIVGYNYDELYAHAEKLKERLMENRRIKEVLINSEFSWWKEDYREFYFNLNRKKMGYESILPIELYAAINPVFTKNVSIGTVAIDDNLEQLKLTAKQSELYDLWSLSNLPHTLNEKSYKLSELVTIQKEQTAQRVAKRNQQYILCIQYEYIGANIPGEKFMNKVLEEFNQELPMGYSAESQNNRWRWGKENNEQYTLLLLVLVIIFFTTSILFNSLKQPLAILFVIPISYIGVFLTFYWFQLNFDQGGFAAFVLLCGITVNASIYILNEFNQIREARPTLSPLRAYIKAWNLKIMPIFLTIISTILGFIPFLVGSSKEAFWFPMGAGTIGGLVMSIVGIFFYLPLFSLKRIRRL